MGTKYVEVKYLVGIKATLNKTERKIGKEWAKKRAILRGEEVENQPIIGELNVISNSIGIVYF